MAEMTVAIVVMLVLLGACLWLPGCLNVDTPDEINIGGGSRADRPPPNVPQTSTHAEARDYLVKAYREIDRLKRENARLRKDRDEYKDKYDRYKDKYEDLKEKHDD